MALELFVSPKMDNMSVSQEAASQGLKRAEYLIRLFSDRQRRPQNSDPSDCSDLTDLAVSDFRKVISLLNRTGHARFRRGPIQSSPSSSSSTSSASLDPPQGLSLAPGFQSPVAPAAAAAQPPPSAPAGFVQFPTQGMTLDFRKPNNLNSNHQESTNLELSVSSSSLFMSSALTGDGSVSNGKLGSSIFLTPAPASSAGGKPPLSSVPYKKRCRDHSDNFSGKASSSTSASGNCHCSKRRKNRVKETIRVPAISSKIADIPADDYSWRKYGQKPIKGSPYPRGYYKCSIVRGCPARKHVEKDPDDPTMLIVRYEGEHRHALSAMQENVGGSKSNK